LGPYNEHLVRDYGAMNLAMGVLLVSAAISLEKRLSQVALLTYLAFAVPHFVFHAAQTHHFSPFHNAVQLGSLGFMVLFPVALLVLTTVSAPPTRGNARGGTTPGVTEQRRISKAAEDRQPVPPSSFVRLVARRPVASFLVMLYAIVWTAPWDCDV
jgi:hypothetical protein